jgi:hypothetical protein
MDADKKLLALTLPGLEQKPWLLKHLQGYAYNTFSVSQMRLNVIEYKIRRTQ